MKIEIFPLSGVQNKAPPPKGTPLGFGKFFTNRMFLAKWNQEKGWHNAEIKPYQDFTLDPAALIFHYGQEIFEGLKAYKWKDGSIALFRADRNADRFNLSAERLSMPHFPKEQFLQAIETLIALEHEWVPSGEGSSLYIRPVMIATEAAIGLKPSAEYYVYIILSPVDRYFSRLTPLKLWIEDQYVRACPGGTGEAKTGANYAASIIASERAKKKGFDQVLWLDGATKRYVEEAGAMNIFFVSDKRLITPPLTGTILHGVTRDSILKLAPKFGLTPEERPLSVDEMLKSIQSGEIEEVFVSGTAAVVSPVGTFGYKDKLFTVGGGKDGEWMKKIHGEITGIQEGKIPDPGKWIRKVPSL